MDKNNIIKNGKNRKIVRGLRKNMYPLKIPNVGYMRFKKQRFPVILNENPYLSLIKIKKMLLNEWKVLPVHKKKEFINLQVNQKGSPKKKNTILSKLMKKKVKIPGEKENELRNEILKNNYMNELYRKAKLDELKRLKETFNNRKEDIANLHKYLEQLQISAREDDFDHNVKSMFYESQLKTFRLNFLKALSEVELPNDIVRPSIHTMDHFMLYIASIILSGEFSHIMPFIKETLSHLEVFLFSK